MVVERRQEESFSCIRNVTPMQHVFSLLQPLGLLLSTPAPVEGAVVKEEALHTVFP